MFGGSRQFGRPPQDPLQNMMDNMFGGSFFGPPSFGAINDPFFGDPFFQPPGIDLSNTRGSHPFFRDPFFGMPRGQSHLRHAAPDARQGATIQEVPHGAEDWPPSNHQPLVEEPDDAGARARSHTRVSPPTRGDEVSPRNHSGGDDIISGWLGGPGSFSSSTQYSSFGPGGGFSRSTTTRRGPAGTVEIEEVTQDGASHTVKTTRRIGDKGRTTSRTRDATGVEETHESLHGLTTSEAEGFDREWAARGGPSSDPEPQRRRPGWLRLPFGNFGGGGSEQGGSRAAGGGNAGATGGPRNITIA